VVLLLAQPGGGGRRQPPPPGLAQLVGLGAARALGPLQGRGRLRVGVLHAEHLHHRVQAAADQADAADVHGHAALDDVVAAHVGVGVGQGGLDLLQRDAELLHPVGVGVDLVALDGAAAAADVHDPRDAAELTLQHPVLQGLEVVERVDVAAGGVLGAVQGVAEDLAGGRLGRQLRRDAGRQGLGELEAVDDLLAGLLEIDAVLELVAQVRQAEQRLGAGVLQAGHAGQRHLQRGGDLALDLLGRRPGELGDDLDDGRGRVGVRLDVDVQEGVDARGDQHGRQQDDDQGGAQPPVDELTDHGGWPSRPSAS
jgi:hypothetical protein